MRTSVSAEAYGKFNKKIDFVAKVIFKTEQQKARIREKLDKCFMFQALEDKEINVVIDAMELKQYKFITISFFVK